MDHDPSNNNLDCWANFQHKVEDLFSCLYNLPETCHISAIEIIEKFLLIFRENAGQKWATQEDSKSYIFLPSDVCPNSLDGQVIHLSSTGDQQAQDSYPKYTQETTLANTDNTIQPAAEYNNVEDVAVCSRKRGRPLGKSRKTRKSDKTKELYHTDQQDGDLKNSVKIEISATSPDDYKAIPTVNGHADPLSSSSPDKNIMTVVMTPEPSESLVIVETEGENGHTNNEKIKEENKSVKQCPYCDKVYTSTAGYNYHMKKHEEAEFKCHFDCKFIGVNKYDLSRHLKTQHGVTSAVATGKNYTCQHCLKNFRTPSQLKFHMRIHTKGPMKCPYCPKEFVSKQGYDQHLCQHTGENLHHCPKCKFSCSSASIVKSHIRLVHDQVRKFLCDSCGKGFATSHILRKHIEGTHSLSEVQGRFSCTECSHKTHCAQSLKAHMRNMHLPPASYTCNICGVSLKYKHSLKLHQMRHYSDKIYKCGQCDFKANCEKNVKEHTRRMHTAATHTCDVCDKTFNDRSHLMRHRVVHTGEKIHKCNLCSYRCNVKHNLRKHMLNVHKLDEKVRNPIIKIDQMQEQESELYTIPQEEPSDLPDLLENNDSMPNGSNHQDLLNQEELYVESQSLTPQQTVYTILNYEAM